MKNEGKIIIVSLRLQTNLDKRLREYCVFISKDKSKIIRMFIKEGLVKHAHIGMLKRWEETRNHHIKKMLNNPNKWTCEKCKSREKVAIYYIDGDITNTTPENIVFLCNRCLMNLQKFSRKFDPKEKFAAWFFFE